MPVPVVVTKGYEPPTFVDAVHAGDRALLLGQHRGDARRRRSEAAAPAAARSLAVCRGGRAGRAGVDVGRAAHPAIPDGIPMPAGRARRARHPAARRAGADRACSRARGVGRAAPSTSSGDRRDQLVADAQPGRRAGPPDRPHPADHLRRRRLGEVAATRWKTQCNENAKVPAFANAVPELCHNEMCGWGQHGDLTRQVFQLVLLRHDDEHPQDSRRFELVGELIDEVVGDDPHRAGRGRRRAGPAARPRPVRRLRQPPPRRPGGPRPRPGPGPRPDQGRPRPRLRPPTIEPAHIPVRT